LEISGEIDLYISGFEMGEIDVAMSMSGDDEEDVFPARIEPLSSRRRPWRSPRA